jgi:colanic acid/amylovoran biosynthesis glycosyltransferase
MRIAVYADVFVRPTETFIYETTRALAASGHEVRVLTRQRLGSTDRPFEPVQVVPTPGRWNARRVLRRVMRPVLGRPEGGESTAIHRDRLAGILARARPEVILANYGPGGVLLAPVARRLGIPLVTSFHGVDASKLLREPIWRERYRRMFDRSAGVTGPSEYVRQRLIEAGAPAERTHVLHYGIPTDRIHFDPPGVRYDGGPVRLLFVGRLTPKKNPIALLRSYAAARRMLDEVQVDSSLTMIGDGPLRDEVEAERAALGLVESVDLRGRVAHEDTIAAYRSAHIYVQHSVTAPDGDEEGLPVSITEALAGGLPVVATRHSGIPEVVREGITGRLVDEGDIEGMGKAIAGLAEQPELWDDLGAAGRRLLEDEFAVEIVQRRLQGLLRDAIAAARHPA